jgi:hypothetical protein
LIEFRRLPALRGAENKKEKPDMRKKLFLLFVLLLAPLVATSAAQELITGTSQFWLGPLGNYGLLGAAFDVNTAIWYPTKTETSYNFCTTCSSVFDLETVGSQTELYAAFTGGLCGPNLTCTYLGSFVNFEPNQATIWMSNGSFFVQISGELVGTYTTGGGQQHNNAHAYLTMMTWPAIDSVTVIAGGSLVVELNPN